MTLNRRTALKLLGLGAASLSLPRSMQAVSAQEPQPASSSLHYIHPEHIIGDVHPFYHEGTWYVYYLAPGFHSRLMTSTDLLHWEQVPITHTPPENPSDLAPYYVLGVFRDSIHDVFRTYHGWTAGNMHSHTSTDLLAWDFAPPSFRVLAQYQRYSSQRDPYVFWNEAESCYWCVMTCKVKGYDDTTNGAVGYASSTDLEHWEGRGDLLFTGATRELEVPQVFSIGDKWYLLASIHDGVAVGKPSYWVSDQPTGPWTTRTPDSLDGEDLAAANVGFDGQRYLLMGWIPLTTPEAHGQYTWGGHLAFPRELYQLDDGSLGTRLEPGISTAIRGDLLLDGLNGGTRVASGEWSQDAPFTSPPGAGEHVLALDGRYDRVDVEIGVRLVDGSRSAMLRLGNYIDAGIDLENSRFVISRRGEMVTPYAKLAFEPQDQYRLRIIVEDDMIEMFVNDRYSLCARLPAALGATDLQLVAVGGVAVDHLRVYRLRSLDEL